MQIEKRKKNQKNNKKVTRAHWSSSDDPVSTVEKILTNLMTLRKITNDDSVPHKPLKAKWALTHLDGSCGLLWSSFMTFFGIIRFVLSISFQRYQWCCYRSFSVSAELFFFPCFFFSLSFSSLSIVNYVKLFLALKRVADDINDFSWVTYVICDSLNYAIFVTTLESHISFVTL